MQENSPKFIQNEDKKIRNLFILGAIAFIIIIVAVIIIYFVIKSGQHTGEIGNVVEPNAYFVNRTDLNHALDTYPAGDVLTHVERVVLDGSEIAAAPSKNRSDVSEFERYTVIIKDVSRLASEPDLTYKATFSVSDDRVYEAIIREDSAWGSDYVCTILSRNNSENSWLFINTNDSANESICKTWGEGKKLNFKEIKTSALSVIER